MLKNSKFSGHFKYARAYMRIGRYAPGLTSSEKRSLIMKRLIPLVISLLVLSGAVAIKFLIPLPPSSKVVLGSVGNETNLNSTPSVDNSTSLLMT